jgi:phosphatidylglycerophosphate synthase
VSVFYRLVARGLTLGRFAATPPFLYILVETFEDPQGQQGVGLGLLFVTIAVSDLLDGFFARLAGASSHRWGQLDALADILFNTASLLIAAWLGLVGIWVPLGVIVLAAMFMHRNRRPEMADDIRLSEDPLGKAAGVVFYLMVGAVVLSLWLQTETARIAVWWLGNLVFTYTLVVLIRNLLPKRLERARP